MRGERGGRLYRQPTSQGGGKPAARPDGRHPNGFPVPSRGAVCRSADKERLRRGLSRTLRRGGIPASGRRQGAHRRSVRRSEEHTSELQSLMRISYAVFCLKKNKTHNNTKNT